MVHSQWTDSPWDGDCALCNTSQGGKEVEKQLQPRQEQQQRRQPTLQDHCP